MNALEQAMEHQARTGVKLYEQRADAMVGPAVTRVRRARTMRGVGLAAGAAAVLVVALVGVLTVGGGGRIAPAAPEPMPVAVPQPSAVYPLLSAQVEERTWYYQDERAERGLHCSLWSVLNSNYKLISGTTSRRLASCETLWLDQGRMVTGTVVSSDQLTFAWTMTNLRSEPITVDVASATLAIELDPDAVPGVTFRDVAQGDDYLVGPTFWKTDTSRLAVVAVTPEWVELAPGTSLTGSAQVPPSLSVNDSAAAREGALVSLTVRLAYNYANSVIAYEQDDETVLLLEVPLSQEG
ncbi:hypothetical protein [Demequina sp.]|uniref:hypothetical protein n=1 Tax=Demequina sp. TaxID=2050685 RepID=UPI0025F34D88|nr:hypothetical protein [Demequina sp.]